MEKHTETKLVTGSQQPKRAQLGAALGLAALMVAVPVIAYAAQPTVPLGDASSFAVLAGAGITNTGATNVSGTAGGDMGSHPTVAFTGETDVTTTGTKYLAGETQVQQAKDSLVTAYDNAAGRTPFSTVAGDIGNQTLVAGVYRSESSLDLSGPLTLNAENDPDAVFIFQVGSELTVAVDSTVVLQNGAQACNVFWQVGSSATFGTDAKFAGTVMALESIAATTRAEFNGRLLARNGEVTLDTNTIVNDACVAAVESEPEAESSPAPAPAPAPENGTVDGGVLPDTGGIQWVIAAAVGAAVLALAAVAFTRRQRRS